MLKLRTEVRSMGRIYSQGIAASGKPRSEVAALRSRCPNAIRTQLTKKGMTHDGGQKEKGEEWAEHVMFASMRAEGKSAFNAGIINGGAAAHK